MNAVFARPCYIEVASELRRSVGKAWIAGAASCIIFIYIWEVPGFNLGQEKDFPG